MSKRYFDQTPTDSYKKPEFPVEEEAPVSPEPKNGVVANAELVNLRRAPSMDATVIIGTVKKNDKFEILDKTDNYWKVKMEDDRTGYLSSTFCKEV